jgi:hypothetical protein
VGAGTKRQILSTTAEKNSKLSVVSIIVAKMMPSAVLANSWRVGSRASCF